MKALENKSKQLSKYRYLFLSLGLTLSLGCVLLAFEAKAKYAPESITWDEPFPGDLPYVPITQPEQPKPPKPKVKTPVLIPVDDPADIDVDLSKIFTFEPNLESFTEAPVDSPEVAPPTPFIVVEEQASFPGGTQAWTRFLRKNIKYPRFAKRSGIEGRVFLSFHVDAEGNISNIEVVRGIGGGCDEEAVRVLKKSPKWNPGRQRGRPVKSPMSIFISFVLK